MEFLQKIKKVNRLRNEKGWTAIGKKAAWHLKLRREKKIYQKWILKHRLDDEQRRRIVAEIADFARQPLISVVLPVYNIEEKWLRLCIESVLKQLYENWEFCIADDQSPNPRVREILEEYAARNPQIKIVFREQNGHISAASNSALELATGEFCVLLDHDDELSEDALFYIAKELNEFSETAFIYSDEDLIDEKGNRFSPKFKPDFSPDLLYSLNLITHLSAYRTDILRQIGGFQIGAEGSQDYDLALRVTEQIDEKQIRHIPHILYHWRAIRGSVAFSADEKPYAHHRAREVIAAHLKRRSKQAQVVETVYNLHRVRYDLPKVLPPVSLILSGADFEKSRGIFAAQSNYENLEIIENTHANAENLNRAARSSNGEILCFVNANLQPLANDWLKELVCFVIQDEIGAVGAKVLDKDEMVSAGGLIIGTKELVSVAHNCFPREAVGNMSRNQLISNYSAVSIDCLAVSRKSFETVGGFDAENLPNALFNVDFCLKLREKNRRVVLTPYVELIEKGANIANIKPNADETAYFKKRWREIIKRDPFYNPNLSPEDGTFTIGM